MKNSIRNSLIYCAILTIYTQIVYAQTADYRDVIINEIMADPTPVVGLPDKEFVELYNRSDKTIDVTGWTIKDASTTKGVFSSASLAPGAYAILCKVADTALYSPFGQVVIVSTIPSLNNNEDSIIISNASGEEIDAIFYKDTWYGSTTKKDGGYTLELINPALNCSDASNWIGSNSTTGGTPGAVNSVYNSIPDTIAPQISSYSVSNPTTITMNFSESVDVLSAQNPNFYNINPSREIAQVVWSSDKKTATLQLSAPLETGVEYTVSVSGISDCEGNILKETSFKIFLGEMPTFNDIIITEIMADPSPVVLLPEFEYIEIYNTSDRAMDLKGVTFSSGSSTITFGEAQLSPHQYALVVSQDGAAQYTMSEKTIAVSSFPALTNSGASLSLKNHLGELLYQVTYSDSWYASSSKKEGGWSLEMVDVTQPCAGRENWKESEAQLGGTPGLPNSVAGILEEQEALKPVSVSYLSNNVIQVNFNGKLNLSMMDAYQINITPGLNILSVTPILPDANIIEIAFQDIIPAGQIFEISLSNFYDCGGNASVETTLQFGVPDSVENGDLIINEILYDPKTRGEDFVELYNISNKIITISDLIFTREDPITYDVISNVNLKDNHRLLLPHEYIVLSAKGESVRAQYTTPGAGVFADVSGFPNLVTDGGRVGIYNQKYEAIDQVNYDPKMHFKLLDETKGVSLERVNPEVPSDEVSNWNSAAISIGGATPGYQNSQYLQPVSRGELTLAPEVFSPDNDGIDDLLGIHYHLDKTDYVGTIHIYTIEGIPVRKLFTNETLAQEGFFTWDGLDDEGKKARVGIYVVVLEIFDLDGNKDLLRAKCVVASRAR